MFFKTGVLENFAHFTAKYLCWSLFLIKLIQFIKKRLQHRCFPVKFQKFLKATFFTETPLVAASVGNDILLVILSPYVQYDQIPYSFLKNFRSNFISQPRSQIILC